MTTSVLVVEVSVFIDSFPRADRISNACKWPHVKNNHEVIDLFLMQSTAASFSRPVLSHAFNHPLGENWQPHKCQFFIKNGFFFPAPLGLVCDSWDFDPAGQYIFTTVHMTRLGCRCEDPRRSPGRSEASWS